MGNEIADCVTVTVSNAGQLVQGDNPLEFLAAARAHLDRAEGMRGAIVADDAGPLYGTTALDRRPA